MNQSELLAANFDEAFNAPEGMKRLRELILSLAMQGKLVGYDPSEGTAADLLGIIADEKLRLVANGKTRASKSLPAIEPQEVPYDLPKRWAWVRLGDITTKLTDGSHNPPRDSSKGFPMLSSQNVNFGKIDFSNPSRYVSEEDFNTENRRTSINPGDVLLTIVASLGRAAIVPENAPSFVLQRSVAVLNAPIDTNFFVYLLSSPVCVDFYWNNAKGTAQKGIYLGQLSVMPIPLPPLAEQRRIVARIDQLMARCDAFEALRTQQEQKRVQVHTAVLRELTAANDPAEFQQNWQFLADHFGELHATPQNVTELRSAILQLAVMGKLVPQDPSEGTAQELLVEIEQEKRRLVMTGQIKAPKPLPPISDGEQPYPVPASWTWVRLNEIGVWKSGSTPSRANGAFYGGNIPWVKSGEVKQGMIDSTEESITQLALDNCSLSVNPPGSLVLAMYGANIGDVGILNINAATNQAICACQPFKIDKEFLFNLLKYLKPVFVLQGAGAAQPNISKEKIINTCIPLPPLLEQRRIVSKFNQLMVLCDMLDTALTRRTAKQKELLGAVMAELAPAVPSKQPITTPHTRAEAPISAEPPRGRGRPRKALQDPTEATSERRGRGRPRKDASKPARSIPEASSMEDAIRRLEAQKLERAQGSRQVSLFATED